MRMKHGWWKSVAILSLILQVGVLAAGLLHFALPGHHDRHHDGREHACPGFPHVHLASPEITGDGHDAQTAGDPGRCVGTAETRGLLRWAMSANVVPCPSEHCLVCSLSDLVRSSDVTPAGEPLVYICSVRRSVGAPADFTFQDAFRPCLPRGPPVVS